MVDSIVLGIFLFFGWVGTLLGFIKGRSLQKEKESLLEELYIKEAEKKELQIRLESDKTIAQEKLTLLEATYSRLKETFEALSAQALERNNQSFLTLAKETLAQHYEQSKGELKNREQAIEFLVKPIQETLGHVDQKLHELEKTRESAYQVLRHQVQDLIFTQKELREETSNLVKALRAPHIRGRWGEMQLRRVVEMSGMSAHCDFLEQESYAGDSGKLRPDMIVSLPQGKQVIIDAKAPLAAYLDAMEAKEENKKQECLRDHARQVRKHILALAKRDYWDHVKQGDVPEFVVLFLPGEPFFSAALEQDPSLIELGVENKVILATPATLIALLHAVAYGWRQEALSKNALEISTLGKELYKRLADMGGHFEKLGSDLNTAVASYNKTIGTLERRVFPSARRFKELETALPNVELDELREIDASARILQSPELLNSA